MTETQFDALTKLLRLRDGPTREVVKKVLVHGYKIPVAAREVGLEYRSAHQAVTRAQRGIELAREASKTGPWSKLPSGNQSVSQS
jgi:hypothetical protein